MFVAQLSDPLLGLVTLPDLLRLLAVPVLAWAAWRDIETRRVPNRTWLPLAVLGTVALLLDSYLLLTDPLSSYQQRLFLIQLAISLGLVAPVGYLFWRIGGFGGADAKALMVIALLFPAYPTIYLSSTALPLEPTAVGVFSLTVLSNTVVVGLCYPLALAARNAAAGRFDKAMFIGHPVAWDDTVETYGRLLETPEGFTRGGLDLDALRMYLQWRGASLADVRADPEQYRDPGSLPETFADPGDGSLATDGGEVADAAETEVGAAAPDDPWGAAQFLEEHSAYGTSPEQLREGLAVLTQEDVVWVTPGIPFLVPMFVGLVVGLTYGDVLFALMSAVGLV